MTRMKKRRVRRDAASVFPMDHRPLAEGRVLSR
jgi:hypothetical protein